MSLEKLKQEIVSDPLNKGYSTMTNEQILDALYTKDIPVYRVISSAELLAWAGGNARLVKLEEASANHASPTIKNIAKIAVKMLDRDETEFDFSKSDRVAMLDALIAGGVFEEEDKTALEQLAIIYQSRAESIGLPFNFMVGDVNWARNN